MTESKNVNSKDTREELYNKNHNSRGRGRSPAEQRESYAQYRKLKGYAIEAEKINDQSLILWPASDFATNEKKFYNMGGHSAVIYVYEIASRIGRTAKLRRDLDNGDKMPYGLCSVRDINALEKKLAQIGVKRYIPRTEKYREGLVFFNLNRKYPKTEIKEMLKSEQLQLDQLNATLFAQVLHPDIHKGILDLVRAIPKKVKNMDKGYRDLIGERMIMTVMDLSETYVKMTHKEMDELSAGRQMVEKLDMILSEISMMNELELWEVSACTRLASTAVGTKNLVKGKVVNKHVAEEQR